MTAINNGQQNNILPAHIERVGYMFAQPVVPLSRPLATENIGSTQTNPDVDGIQSLSTIILVCGKCFGAYNTSYLQLKAYSSRPYRLA